LCLGYRKGAKTEAKKSRENANISKTLVSMTAVRKYPQKVHTLSSKIGGPKQCCMIDGI